MKSIYFYLPIFVIHLASLDEWWNQEGKGYSPCEYSPCVCEAACLKDTLMPADPLQPTFTLEISCWCNGLLLATLPATPWSLSELWIDSFPWPLTGVLISVLSSVCHQISEWRWKDLHLTLYLSMARYRSCNPKAVLPHSRAWIHPIPVLVGAAIAQGG